MEELTKRAFLKFAATEDGYLKRFGGYTQKAFGGSPDTKGMFGMGGVPKHLNKGGRTAYKALHYADMIPSGVARHHSFI